MTAVLALFAAGLAQAQEPAQKQAVNPQQKQALSPEQKAQKAAEGMAAKLFLSDADAAKFVPVYKAYKLEYKDVNEKFRREKGASKTDAQIEADIVRDFERSQAILDLRKAYFEKFKKVISLRQIREMYKIEKEKAEHQGQKPKGSKPDGPRPDGPRPGRVR